MERLNRYIVEHPWLFIGINTLITVTFAVFAWGLVIDDDLTNYLPDNDPVVTAFRDIDKLFEGNAVGVVMVETDDIFTNDALQHIDRLTDLFSRVEGVNSAVSLTNVMDMRADGDAMQVERLIDENPAYSSTELVQLKEYVMGKDLYAGNLVSEDGRFALIMVKLDSNADTLLAVDTMDAIIEAESAEGQYKHYRTGAPFFGVDGDRAAKQDLRRLLPTVILVVLLVLFLTFRTLRGVLIPLVAVLVSVIWAMGLVSATGQSLTTVGIAIPVILVSVGSAYGIHVMNEYYSVVRSEETKKDDLVQAMGQVGVPLLLSCLTTMAGFASLVTADLLPIKQFGSYTVFGVLAAFITAFSLIPAMLSIVPYRPSRRQEEGNSAAFTKLGSRIFQHRTAIVVVVLALVALGISQFPKLTYDTDLAGFFKPDHPTSIAIDLVNDHFGGSSPLQVHIKGDLKSPFVLRQMQTIEGFLEDADTNNPVSYATLIEEANKTINGPSRIPATRNQVSSLGLFLEGQDQLKSYVTSDYAQGLVVSRVAETKSTKMAGTNDKIRAFLDTLPKSAYVIDLDLAEGELAQIATDSLQAQLAGEISGLLWAKPTAAQLGQVNDALDELQSFEWTAFARDYSWEIEEIIEDNLDPEVLWFELDDVATTSQLAFDMLATGSEPEAMADAFEEVNPHDDPFDLEDLAFDLWEDAMWVYQDIRNSLVETIALDLVGEADHEVTVDALAGVLSDIWVNEVYLTDLPAEYRQNPAVRLDDFEVMLTGSPVIYEVTTSRLQASQWRSLMISLCLVALLLILQLRSIPMGIIACLPIVLTVLINFATMAITGIALDVATTMIASVAVGTGVDYSIHFANRLRRARGQNGSLEDALKQTLSQVGTAITANALSVALGFMVLMLSSTVTIIQFGGLTALTMIVSAILALVFLPAVFALTGVVHSKVQSKAKEGVM
ncbi:MAG: MMPL family transporter [Firmicutes bacterium]|nr:MMPL family transporter [Bacillota bacterium]